MFKRLRKAAILNIVVCVVFLVPAAVALIIKGLWSEGSLVLIAIAALTGVNIINRKLVTEARTKYLLHLLALAKDRKDHPNDRASGRFGIAQFNGGEWRYIEETGNISTHGICPYCRRSWVTSRKKIFCVCGGRVEVY